MRQSRGDAPAHQERQAGDGKTEHKRSIKRRVAEHAIVPPLVENMQQLMGEGDENPILLEDKDIEKEIDLTMKPDRKITVRYPKKEHETNLKKILISSLESRMLERHKKATKKRGIDSLEDYMGRGGKPDAEKLLRIAGFEDVTSLEEIAEQIPQKKREAKLAQENAAKHSLDASELTFARPLALAALERLFEKTPEAATAFNTEENAPSKMSPIEALLKEADKQFANQRETRRVHESQFRAPVFDTIKREMTRLLDDVENRRTRRQSAKTDVMPTFNQSRIERLRNFARDKRDALLEVASGLLGKKSAQEAPDENALNYETSFSDNELIKSLLHIKSPDEKSLTLPDIMGSNDKFIPFDQQLAKIENVLSNLSSAIAISLERRVQQGKKPIETLEDIVLLNQPTNPELHSLSPEEKAAALEENRELKKNIVLQEAMGRTVAILEQQIELMEEHPTATPDQMTKKLDERLQKLIPRKQKGRTTRLFTLTAEFKALNTQALKRLSQTLEQLKKAAA